MTSSPKQHALAGIFLLMLVPTLAMADEYVIVIFQSTSGVWTITDGNGAFNFDNPRTGEFDSPPVPAQVNLSVDGIGTLTYVGEIKVAVREVDYNDGKKDAEHGANQIQGYYVEGIFTDSETGALTSAQFAGSELSFDFEVLNNCTNPTLPNCYTKTYSLDFPAESIQLAGGNYHVGNRKSIPEPGTLTLLLAGALSLARSRRRSKRRAAHALANAS